MNLKMIRFLVAKDWYLFRWATLIYIAAGLASIAIASINREEAFYLGAILILTVVISLGIHLAIGMILEERTRKTLPFVLSLPVTPKEYMLAKCISTLSLYLVPWLVILGAMWTAVLIQPSIPNGVLPFFSVTLLEILAVASCLIAISLLTESMAWTIALMVTTIFSSTFTWLALAEIHRLPNRPKQTSLHGRTFY